MGQFKHKVALVTGGTSGIGEAITKELVLEGAFVYFVGRNKEKGEKVLLDIDEMNCLGQAKFIQCDITEESSIKYIKEAVKGDLHILINNAGIFDTPFLEEIDKNRLQKSMDINFSAPLFITQAFIENLKKNNGNIINISSTSGLQSHIAGSRTYVYAASKSALIQFSQLCSLNFAPEVRVNCVCPGITDTPIYTNRDFSRFSSIPLKRVAQAKEIANAVLFLASDRAAYITGAVLTVDGGASLL